MEIKCLSPAQGPRSPILAPNAVENPAYRGKSDSPKPLKSPANAPHSPGMGVRGFPLTSALEPESATKDKLQTRSPTNYLYVL